MTPEDYLKKPYSRCFVPDGEGGYTAYIREFPGCITEVKFNDFGSTLEDAYVELESTAEDWLAAALDQGQEIPEPEKKI